MNRDTMTRNRTFRRTIGSVVMKTAVMVLVPVAACFMFGRAAMGQIAELDFEPLSPSYWFRQAFTKS